MLVKQAPESGAVEIAAEGTASLADLVQTASQFGIEREVDQIASKAGLTPRASREGLPSAPSGPRVITKHLVRRGGRVGVREHARIVERRGQPDAEGICVRNRWALVQGRRVGAWAGSRALTHCPGRARSRSTDAPTRFACVW